MTLKKLLLLLLLIILVTGVYYVYLKSKIVDQTPISITDVSEESPDSISNSSQEIINKVPYKLPAGEQVYNLSHGDKVVGPRAGKISYNPLPIVPDRPQTITVTFPQTEKVSSAVIFIDTDNFEGQKLNLQKTNDSASNIWAGTWTPKDTNHNRYRVRFYFVGPAGTYNAVSNIL